MLSLGGTDSCGPEASVRMPTHAGVWGWRREQLSQGCVMSADARAHGRAGSDQRSTPVVRSGWPTVALVALTVVVLLEVLRTLYPLGYALVGSFGFIVTPVLLLGVFLSPLLAPLVRTAGPRGSLLTCVGGLAAVRLLLQLLAPPSLWAAVLASAGSLVAVTVVLSAVLADRAGAAATALGFVAAIGIDAALKSAYAAWDRVWQPGPGPLLVTVVVLGALLAAGWVAVGRGLVLRGEPAHGRVGRLFALLVLLMPAMLMLQSVAYVGSSGQMELPWAALVTIGGAAVALPVTAAAAAAGVGRFVGLVTGTALVACVWAMTSVTGPFVAVLAVVGQVLTGVLLAAVLADEPTEPWRPGIVRSAVGSTLGFVALFVLTLLYPFHYEMPLPVPNTVLPPLAVALSLLGLLSRRTHKDDRNGVAEPTFSARAALVPAFGLLAAALAIGAGLVLTAARPAPLAVPAFPLTVATFNTNQGAAAGGALDFVATADQITALDADVVALQEVARGLPLSGMNDFAAWLQHTRGTTQYYAPAADRQFGNLLLTRVEVSDVQVLALPQGGGSMKRSAIEATVDVPGAPVTVFAAHLQHRNTPGSVSARDQELQVILDRWAGAPRTIILGDLNVNNQPAPNGGAKLLVGADQANTLQPLLDAGFTTTQPTTRCTMPTSNDNCSDYVLVTPDLSQQPPVQVLPQSTVSDHHAVVSVLVLR